MRRLLGLVLALAGCLKPSAKQCHDGWTCPSDLECVAAPTFCGSPNEVKACSGAAEFSTCSTSDVPAGYCEGGTCQLCTVDEAACAAPTWTQMTYSGADLTAISVRAPDSAIAVGGGTIAEWDGHAWTARDVASPDILKSVAVAPGATDAWIAGAKLDRWNGSALTMPYAPAPSVALTSTWASSPTDVYAVGTGSTIVHGDGTSFTAMALPVSRTLQAIAGSSASDIYVVGTPGMISHFDGTSWATPMLPGDVATVSFRAVWVGAPDDVFVVGNGSTILHFDGQSWTHSPVTGVPGGLALRSVWGSGPRDVYAVGGDQMMAGYILHFDGQAWTSVFTVPVQLSGISGSGPHEVIAVGPNKTVLRATP